MVLCDEPSPLAAEGWLGRRNSLTKKASEILPSRERRCCRQMKQLRSPAIYVQAVCDLWPAGTLTDKLGKQENSDIRSA